MEGLTYDTTDMIHHYPRPV